MMARNLLGKCFLLVILLALSSQSACNSSNGSPPSEPAGSVTPLTNTMIPGETRSITLTSVPAVSPTPEQNVASSTDSQFLTPFPSSTQPDGGTLPTTMPTVKLVCDKAAPGSPIDITIPDNSRMVPGQAFTKVWRLVNIGHCKWTGDYSAEWFSGDRFSDTRVVSLGAPISEGESVDITVDMVAPLAPGTYQSNWKLRNPDKKWFGIGPSGDQVFWVRIVVIQVNTNTPVVTATESPPSPTPTPTAQATITPTETLTPTATPVVLISGSITLSDSQRIDLDTAQVNAGGEDLAFQKDSSNNHWFTPLSGAVLGVYGGTTPNLQICLSANMSAAPIAVESLSPGTALCYRTEQSRIGWLRYDSFDPSTESIKLTILTWVSP